MSGTQFSIGSDCTLVVIGPSGQIDLTYVTGFESRQLTAQVRVDRLDGVQMGAELPRGWEGGFDLERGTADVDNFIASIEAAYYAQGAMPTSTVYQYIAEVDGSVSTFQYSDVVFRLANAGSWRGDAPVRQRLEFFASFRTRV